MDYIMFLIFGATLLLYSIWRHNRTMDGWRSTADLLNNSYVRYNNERRRIEEICLLKWIDAEAMAYAILANVTAEQIKSARPSGKEMSYKRTDVERVVAYLNMGRDLSTLEVSDERDNKEGAIR